jgi:uncharacterized protein YdcH (DUF465 family)
MPLGTETYHMIDRCEPGIATWSMDGSNFVVKNVEKFASAVLPLYFKHSNFSSFARQLNFYGFRKLRTDPILTSDVDPRTACYVRFYHEKFQKDHPELLHQIKRATKSDQQSKDDVDSLKGEVSKLKDNIAILRDDTDRRLAEMAYECNRRINNMGAEHEKLAAIVQQLLAASTNSYPPLLSSSAISANPTPTATATTTAAGAPSALPPSSSAAVEPCMAHHNPHAAAIAAAAAVAAGAMVTGSAVPEPAAPTSTTPPPTPVVGPTIPTLAAAQPRMPDLMHSLSQAAAISLQQQQNQATSTNKRPADGESMGAPPAKQQQPQQQEAQSV